MGTPRESETTTDRVFGNQIILEQPRSGYRAAIDPILLAAAIQAKPGDRVLDAGFGVGAGGLCLAKRLARVSVIGVEIQQMLCDLALRNIQANGMEDRVSLIAGDINDPALAPLTGPVDQIMTNPPFFEASQGQQSPNASKDQAHRESDLTLAQWIKACRRFLKHKGMLTIIFPADRLDDLLTSLNPHFGNIQILPLWPSNDGLRPAKRVLVNARLGVKTPLRLMPGLVLHDGDGYSEKVERILQGNGSISIISEI